MLGTVYCEPREDVYQAQDLAPVKPVPTEMGSVHGLASHFIYTYPVSGTLLNRASPWRNVTFYPEVKYRASTGSRRPESCETGSKGVQNKQP